jgi:hypothetical protein
MYIKIYCGNLPFDADDMDLRALFKRATMGEVVDAHVFYDEKKGYSRGFGAVRVPKEKLPPRSRSTSPNIAGAS